MTQPDKWDHDAKALVTVIGAFEGPIQEAYALAARVLRSAYAQGEKAGMERLASIIHALDDHPKLMQLFDEAIRAAKENKE